MSYQVAIEVREGRVHSVRSFDGQTVKGVVVDFDVKAAWDSAPYVDQVGDERAHVYITHEGGKPRNLKRLMELWREHKKHDR